MESIARPRASVAARLRAAVSRLAGAAADMRRPAAAGITAGRTLFWPKTSGYAAQTHLGNGRNAAMGAGGEGGGPPHEGVGARRQQGDSHSSVEHPRFQALAPNRLYVLKRENEQFFV